MFCFEIIQINLTHKEIKSKFANNQLMFIVYTKLPERRFDKAEDKFQMEKKLRQKYIYYVRIELSDFSEFFFFCIGCRWTNHRRMCVIWSSYIIGQLSLFHRVSSDLDFESTTYIVRSSNNLIYSSLFILFLVNWCTYCATTAAQAHVLSCSLHTVNIDLEFTKFNLEYFNLMSPRPKNELTDLKMCDDCCSFASYAYFSCCYGNRWAMMLVLYSHFWFWWHLTIFNQKRCWLQLLKFRCADIEN